jgi:hypothetical protein
MDVSTSATLFQSLGGDEWSPIGWKEVVVR